MPNLYELSSDLAEVMRAIDEADGVVEGDLEARLDAVSVPFVEKLEGIAAIDRMLELRADAYRAEEKRLADRRRAVENERDRLRAYAVDGMRRVGMPKVVGKLFTLSVKRNPPALHLLVDDDAVPEVWTKTRREVDRAAIKAALQTGTVLPWAELTQGEALVIR